MAAWDDLAAHDADEICEEPSSFSAEESPSDDTDNEDGLNDGSWKCRFKFTLSLFTTRKKKDLHHKKTTSATDEELKWCALPLFFLSFDPEIGAKPGYNTPGLLGSFSYSKAGGGVGQNFRISSKV